MKKLLILILLIGSFGAIAQVPTSASLTLPRPIIRELLQQVKQDMQPDTADDPTKLAFKRACETALATTFASRTITVPAKYASFLIRRYSYSIQQLEQSERDGRIIINMLVEWRKTDPDLRILDQNDLMIVDKAKLKARVARGAMN